MPSTHRRSGVETCLPYGAPQRQSAKDSGAFLVPLKSIFICGKARQFRLSGFVALTGSPYQS